MGEMGGIVFLCLSIILLCLSIQNKDPRKAWLLLFITAAFMTALIIFMVNTWKGAAF